jgi:integrase
MKNDDTKKTWTPTRNGLCRYIPSGQYYARVRFAGKLHRRKLGKDFPLAKRKLAEFKRDLERTDHSKGNMSLAAVLDAYAATLTGSDSTLWDKRFVVEKLKQTLFGAATQPLRMFKSSQIEAWLAKHYGSKSASYYNGALSVVRSALDMAVRDKIITENPASHLTYRKRKKPIRPTPTVEQFRAIVASVREQKFNGHDAEASGDLLEFLGLAGLGQAEAAAIKREHVDLDSDRIIVYRHKTDTGFVIPIYPQVRPLIEKLCDGKTNGDRLFPIDQARKALNAACKRLGFPRFTHRSLRRMFISRLIEKGIDVKVIAQWQGHRDGGKLILDTYSHVNPQHANRMARLVTDDIAANAG